MWLKIKSLSPLDERSKTAGFLRHSKVTFISGQSCVIKQFRIFAVLITTAAHRNWGEI